MSVGGIVVEVVVVTPSKVRITTIDTSYRDEVSIYVENTPELPDPGDMLWWQAENAYWTPADQRFEDRPLVKIGYSF